MKILTKILTCILTFMMVIGCFVACGEKPAETTVKKTEAETTKAVTTVPAETTQKVCDHRNKLKKTGITKAPTCVEEGFTEYVCTSCGEKVKSPIEKVTHTYSTTPSADGNYTQYVCVVCKDTYVLDKTGAKVTDTSSIVFPLFYADFENITKLEDYTALYPDFSIDMAKSYANVVKNNPNGEKYLNIPTGNYGIAQNGRFALNDIKNSLVGGFTLSFSMEFPNFPKDQMALVTWTVGGHDYTLLSIDSKGNIYNAAGDKLGTSKDKGWDTVVISVAANGSYSVTLNDLAVGTGTITVEGSTGSVLTFMGLVSEFEAYFDNIKISQ